MRPNHSSDQRRSLIRLLCAICILVLVAGCVYIVCWMQNRSRILEESERYSLMYHPSEPTPTAVPDTTDEPLPEVVDIPLPTPDAGTLVYALETAPPVQQSFGDLLTLNPDTVGFLTVGDLVSLPIVQRLNDNEYYLNHTFAQEEKSEGALFLDGFNRLVPEDDCLIVYGHNMQNGTMFGSLKQLLSGNALLNCPTVTFDTIYENRSYVPFAIFTASMNPSSAHYFDVRQFVFDDQSFDSFVAQLRSLSVCNTPVDVAYGDSLLLLVTCDYNNDDGRLILALRKLRDGENASD